MAPINVGIAGYGSSAKIFHLPFILFNPDLKVVAFLQRAEAPKDKSDVEPGTHCTVDYPHANHYRDSKEFFADSSIELVIVCTTSATHYEFGKLALNAGKHVVVEKPFAVTSAEADRLIALAKQKQKVLTVFQNRRYDSDFRTLLHLMNLKPNPFGKVTEFANHFDVDFPDWVVKRQTTEYEPGEGLLHGLGSHSIDQTLLLFGLPKSVTAFSRVLRMEDAGNAAEDSFTIILQYDGDKKGLISTIKTTIVTPQIKQMKYWLRGATGSFLKKGEDVQVENLLEFNMKPEDPDFGVEPTRYHGTLYTRTPSHHPKQDSDEPAVVFSGKIPSQPGCYMDYYRDVVATIRGEKELVVKPEQARDVIRVIELAKESVENGVTVTWSRS